MRITQLTVYTVHVNQRGNWLFILLHTDSGFSGVGEASHGAVGPFKDNHVRDLLENACFPLLLGADPQAPRAIIPLLHSLVTNRASATAVSACEQALWDLAGQAAQLPVYRLLGGPKRHTIPLYANINRAVFARTPEEFATKAVAAATEGYQALKCAPFDGINRRQLREPEGRQLFQRGLDVIAAIRQAIGTTCDIYVDCHGCLDLPHALQAIHKLERLGIWWIEDPLPADDFDGLLELRHRAPNIELIGGEQIFGLKSFWRYLQASVWNCIMPDIKHCGGLAELLLIAEAAIRRGIHVALHNPSGPIATIASAHVAAILPEFRILEYAWGEVPWRHNLITPPEHIAHGQLHLSTQPGLGIHLNRTLLQNPPDRS